MNRRSFLTRLSTGLVGACAVTHLSISFLPAKVRSTAALEYLRKIYNDYSKGSAHAPRMIYASRGLYEAAKSELVTMQRERRQGYYTNARHPESLMFKGATLVPCDDLGTDSSWSVAVSFDRDSTKSEMIVIREEFDFYRRS